MTFKQLEKIYENNDVILFQNKDELLEWTYSSWNSHPIKFTREAFENFGNKLYYDSHKVSDNKSMFFGFYKNILFYIEIVIYVDEIKEQYIYNLIDRFGEPNHCNSEFISLGENPPVILSNGCIEYTNRQNSNKTVCPEPVENFSSFNPVWHFKKTTIIFDSGNTFSGKILQTAHISNKILKEIIKDAQETWQQKQNQLDDDLKY